MPNPQKQNHTDHQKTKPNIQQHVYLSLSHPQEQRPGKMFKIIDRI